MASVYKDKDGYWNAQVQIGYYDSGKRKYKRFRADTKKEVQKRLNDYLLKTGNLAIVPELDDVTVSEYMNQYINLYKKHKLKSSSLTRERGIFKNQIEPTLGGFPIKKLSTNIIQSHLVNKLKVDNYSLSTIHKAYTLLNECMKKAVQENKLFKNPCDGVELPNKNIIAPKDIEILNDEEIEEFMKVAHTNKYKNSLAIATILYTGLRCGELCALHWSDIDFTNNVITVHRNIGVSYENGVRKTFIQEGTKTKAVRKVPLNTNARNILISLFVKAKGRKLVLESRGEIPAVSSVGKTYNRMLAYAGIEGRTGIHTLRHTFASQLIKKGVDIKIISEILGHSSVSFTYNTYIHLFPEQKTKALEVLDY